MRNPGKQETGNSTAVPKMFLVQSFVFQGQVFSFPGFLVSSLFFEPLFMKAGNR